MWKEKDQFWKIVFIDNEMIVEYLELTSISIESVAVFAKKKSLKAYSPDFVVNLWATQGFS